ncbi:MAG: hypothetical protein ACYC3W_02285 [Candidatus Nanopelagicales bacterium]
MLDTKGTAMKVSRQVWNWFWEGFFESPRGMIEMAKGLWRAIFHNPILERNK